tara:strand:- start:6880 stop:7311 length:432 start_codon:yes stop_codon:yes gene_type:complete
LQGSSRSEELCKLGSKVKIDVEKIKEKFPAVLINQIKKNPVGTVIDYKMTDGSDIGIVVELENKAIGWFFYREINELSKEGNVIYKSDTKENTGGLDNILLKIIDTSIAKSDIKSFNVKSNINNLLKPTTFLNWFIYSIKDIV